MNKLKFIFILVFSLLFTKFIFAQSQKSGTLRIEIKSDTNSLGNYSTSWNINIDVNSNTWTYPDSAKIKNIQGNICFTLTLKKNCEIDSIKINKGLGYGLDETARNILQNLNIEIYANGIRIQDCSMLEKVNIFKKREINSCLKFQLM